MSLGTVVAAIVARASCRHEDIYRLRQVRHPVDGTLITETLYLQCRHCLRTTPGWITKGGVQSADAPTRWIRR